MSSFQGIWVPIVTPFHHGAIDFDGLRRLVSHLLEKKGVDGIVVCGTTGEAAALGNHEQLAVLDAVLELVPPERVVMGLAGNNLAELLTFQSEILKRSLAGLLVPPPYYIRPSQAGLEAFFQDRRRCVQRPGHSLRHSLSHRHSLRTGDLAADRRP